MLENQAAAVAWKTWVRIWAAAVRADQVDPSPVAVGDAAAIRRPGREQAAGRRAPRRGELPLAGAVGVDDKDVGGIGPDGEPRVVRKATRLPSGDQVGL